MDKHWFTRFYQKEVDTNYIKNMMMIVNDFLYWFKHGKKSYSEMLLDAHKIASEDYSGITNDSVKIDSGFRKYGIPLLSDGSVPKLQKNWFSGISSFIVMSPVIPEIPHNMKHWVLNKEDGYYLYLPGAKYLPYYLYILSRIMDELKKDITLPLLAKYIQLFVIAHPFYKINFSMCMAQVNALLQLKGYKPIYHGYLDFNCFLYDYDRIEEIFINKVKGIEYIKEE